MAVVQELGDLYVTQMIDPRERVDHRYKGSNIKATLEKVSIAVGDEATSTYHVARVPKSAVLLPGSRVRSHAVVTGTFDFGGGNDVDGLLSGSAGAATTDYPIITNYVLAGQPLWQVLAYASSEDAPEEIDLFITLRGSTQATAAASLIVFLMYTYS